MPKNQKIKAAVDFGNYHGSLAIFWKGGLHHKNGLNTFYEFVCP
ncbi:hypothetical protein SAMN02745246_04131, partial [Leeuwenhoekiella marinoflava DSM 3653]